MRRHLWLRDSELERIQNKMLTALVTHAYNNVPFYHRTWKALDLKPRDIKTSKDLVKLPIIKKKDIQKNPRDFLARNIELDKCKKHLTSGSTGSRVIIYCDQKAEDFRAAVFTRPFLECGLGIRDKAAFITFVGNFPRRQRWYQLVGFIKRIYISASTPEEETLGALSSYKPDMIYSYSSYLHLIAGAMKTVEPESLEPKLLVGTGELLHNSTRSFIESIFGVDMLDFYGSVEVERTAWECSERAGYHMDVDSVITEFVKNNEVVAAGERGELTLTCLHNYAMPLIRYNIEDTGIPTNEKCPCGRSLPLMKEIEGRSNDYVILKDGRMISPLGLLNAIWAVSDEMLSEYRIIQASEDSFIIKVIGKKSHSDKITSQIQESMKEIVGKSAKIEVQMVNRIRKSPSGKTKIVVSKVPRAF